MHTHEALLGPHCLPSHAGFLLDFISFPVIKGFTSAASITISFNQIKVGSAPSWMPLQLSPRAVKLGYSALGWVMCLVLEEGAPKGSQDPPASASAGSLSSAPSRPS